MLRPVEALGRIALCFPEDGKFGAKNAVVFVLVVEEGGQWDEIPP